jgi:LPS sulfotransferase NodH
MQDWASHQEELRRLSDRQLFFLGGAPRSGTTWLQQILDTHPEISCRGEGLFMKHLAEPMNRLVTQWGEAITAKNAGLFSHTGGYPPPDARDAEFLIATAIMQALHRQSAGRNCRAVGEKTPENVFFFPKLKQMFPYAKFIFIARDPRDVLTSAWHFFQSHQAGVNEAQAKMAFIRMALPSLEAGVRALLSFQAENQSACMVVTYEELRRAPASVLAPLLQLLGVSDQQSIIEDCLARTSFAAQTAGRPAGVAQNGAFLRKGTVGDWTTTLTAEMNAVILEKLGWMFPHFGWHF